MAEYIDRLDAYLAIGQKVKEGRNALNEGLAAAIDAIGAMPAADVQPVRHGRWVQADEQPYFRKHYHTMICSECRKKKNGNWNYCPNCGAKQDGGET